MAGQNFSHSQRRTRNRHGNQRNLLASLQPRQQALRITAKCLLLASLPVGTCYGGAAGTVTAYKNKPVVQMPQPLIMSFKATAQTTNGTPASTTPKQTLAPDSSTGQSTAGGPAQQPPATESSRGRPSNQTDQGDRARSRSVKRRAAAEKKQTDLANAEQVKIDEAAAADITAKTAAAAAEKLLTDKSTQGAAAAGSPLPEDLFVAATTETVESPSDQPRKQRRTKTDDEHNADDDMSEPAVETPA